MQVDTSIPYLGTWLGDTPTSGDDAWPAFNVFNGSAEAVKAYSVESARIRADAGYNEYAAPAVKRQAAITAFAKTVLTGRAARFQDLLDRVAATIATNELALSKSGPAIGEERQAAIWHFFSRLNADDVTRKIREAIASGDRETISAILGAPKCFAFVSDDERPRITDAFLRVQNPDAYDALTNLKTALQVSTQAWNRAQSWIHSDAGIAAFKSTGA